MQVRFSKILCCSLLKVHYVSQVLSNIIINIKVYLIYMPVDKAISAKCEPASTD